MGHVSQLAPRVPGGVLRVPEPPREPLPQFRFQSLVLTEPESLVGKRSATFSVSLIVHGALLAAVVLVPLLMPDLLPATNGNLRAFFVQPADVAPPPPPPPPPAQVARVVPKAPVAQSTEPPRFVAPVEVPTEIVPDAPGLDIGVEGGVPGGVEGGVPGGVVGGVVGGLPAVPAPSLAERAVRVGGVVKAPKLVHRVQPEYPGLAVQARLQAMIILEALVNVDGRVHEVKVLRGAALFDEAAIAAVKQWRYQPLLLNGVPTPFILTVTLNFNLQQAPERSGS
jgi:protein TonB